MQFVAAILIALVGVVAFFFILVPLLRVIGRLIAHVFRFIASEIGDTLRILGGILTSVVFAPLVVLSVVLGRWSAARHYGASIQDEVASIGYSFYRIVIGNPARLLGLTALTDGIERRVPEAMAKAPGRDKPRRSTGQFDGYKIVGSIAGGGSGARLYVAEPDEIKRVSFERQGLEVDQVVIKSFSLKEGSSLPQIIREGRALEAAKKIGLVLEHDLTEQRFFYVMPYVPGDALGKVTQRMHDAAGPSGLDDKRMNEALGFVSDLLSTLERYHRAGLWHKDVKPDNIIIHDGRAHVVDLGLVTPLRSAMTLTTHGTEYFRDPELVRMALKGVKVHEVNGVKFDVYAAGAVLYSAVENSFPAHGGLSHLTKRCPDSVRWIIRRAMTDYNNRYNSANEMMADLDAVRLSGDAFAMRPADLPSMNGKPAPSMAEAPADVADFETVNVANVHAAARADAPTPEPAQPAGARRSPRIREVHWLTGRYIADDAQNAPHAEGMNPEEAIAAGFAKMANIGAETARFMREGRESSRGAARTPRVPRERRAPATEQLRRARERAEAARRRAHSRVRERSKRGRYNSNPNRGALATIVVFLIVVGAVTGAAIKKASESRSSRSRLVMGAPGAGGGPAVQMQFDEKDIEEIRTFLHDEFNIDTRNMDAEGVHEFASEIEERVGSFLTKFTKQLPGARRVAPEAPAVVAIVDSASVDAPSAPSVWGELEGQRWLVLSDVGESAEPAQRDAVDRLIEALQDAGSEIVDRGSDDPAAIDLLASIRATLGTVQSGDPEASTRINAWLEARTESLDGLVWLPAPTGPNVTVQVYSPNNDAEQQVRRALRRVTR